MTGNAFQITPERTLAPCSLDVAQTGKGSVPFWIDFDRRDESLRPFLTSMGAHPLAIDACLDPTPGSLIAPYGTSLFIALPVQAQWDVETRTFLWALCLPTALITIHESEIPALEHVIPHYTTAMRFHDATTSAVLYQLVDFTIDDDIAFTLKSREALVRVEQVLEDKSGDEWAGAFISLKRQLARLDATFEDQLYCISSLQSIDSEAFSTAELQEYFRDAFLHLEHASRIVGRQLSHMNAIQQQYQLTLQDRTNNRLRLLTIISTIFLPLMLITGIYGMNLRLIPGLTSRYGSLIVIVFMVVVTGAMLWQFRRSGWFD